jgi:S1-C subfamily serine protease
VESPTKEEDAGELVMEIESSVTADDWRRALSVVVPSVVILRTTASRAFDTEVASASYAMGFVVDKTRGIILTNHHVVKPGRNCCLQHPFSRILDVYSRDL